MLRFHREHLLFCNCPDTNNQEISCKQLYDVLDSEELFNIIETYNSEESSSPINRNDRTTNPINNFNRNPYFERNVHFSDNNQSFRLNPVSSSSQFSTAISTAEADINRTRSKDSMTNTLYNTFQSVSQSVSNFIPVFRTTSRTFSTSVATNLNSWSNLNANTITVFSNNQNPSTHQSSYYNTGAIPRTFWRYTTTLPNTRPNTSVTQTSSGQVSNSRDQLIDALEN